MKDKADVRNAFEDTYGVDAAALHIGCRCEPSPSASSVLRAPCSLVLSSSHPLVQSFSTTPELSCRCKNEQLLAALACLRGTET